MAEKSKELYEFKKKLALLEQFRGRGTELITVYIPPKYQISEVTSKLKEEFGQASNIKSATTKKNVQGALEKIMQHLKIYKQPPDNGMAIFAGNVSESEGKQDIQLFAVIPPQPINVQFYRCESTFQLEPLKEMLEKTGTYGIIVMDGNDATLAILRGTQMQVIHRVHSTAHKKVMKGGQCVHEDSLIQLSSGASCKIREIKEGDGLTSFDLDSIEAEKGKCQEVFSRTSSIAYKIITRNPRKTLYLTPEHVVFYIRKNSFSLKSVEKLQEGDMLLYCVGEDIKSKKLFGTQIVEKKEVNNPQGLFYDVAVQKNSNFLVENILVHNSARRYERLHEEGVEYYYKRVGEAMDAYLSQKAFKGIILGGPGPAKEDFMKLAPFNYQLKVLGVVDTGYTDEYGLREVLEKSGEIISEQEAIKQKKLLDEFMREAIKSEGGMVVYGAREIKKALDDNKVSKLLVSEDFDLVLVKAYCSNTLCPEQGKEVDKIVERSELEGLKCVKCSSKLVVRDEINFVENLVEQAENQGVSVEMISDESAEGSQFLATFKGLGAFLRYR